MGVAAAAPMVSLLVPEPGAAIVAGVNVSVTPVGTVVVSATAPLKPLATVLVKVAVVLAPGWTVAPGELNVSANAGTTVKLTVAVEVNPPPVAVTVIVEAPGAAVTPAVTVNTLEPDPGAGKVVGASAAVTPAGAPLTASVTAFENPPATVIVAVDVPLPPARTVNALTDIAALIDFGVVTVTSFQKLTRSLAFTVPSPVARSYPMPAVAPVNPGMLLFPLVTS